MICSGHPPIHPDYPLKLPKSVSASTSQKFGIMIIKVLLQYLDQTSDICCRQNIRGAAACTSLPLKCAKALLTLTQKSVLGGFEVDVWAAIWKALDLVPVQTVVVGTKCMLKKGRREDLKKTVFQSPS